jgi:tricorn protease
MPERPRRLIQTVRHSIRIDPAAEWKQMYHEVWRIERAYFYDPNFHGVDTVAEERRFEPYGQAIAARSDLNYIFQEMFGGFSVGHLRGNGGAIPEAKKVPGGLLGAEIRRPSARVTILNWRRPSALPWRTWAQHPVPVPQRPPYPNYHQK